MLSRELKVGIIGGIISSILVIIFIQPILGWMWDVVLAFGETIQAGYLDKIYRNAAIGEQDKMGLFTLLLLMMMVALAVKPKINVGIFGRIDRYFNIFTLFTIPLMLILLLIVSSVESGVIRITASFNQRLTVLAPMISEQEYKVWKARWANMNGQADYRTLVVDMEKRASDLKTQLPKLLY